MNPEDLDPDGTDVAIVGMSGRFPGAPDVDALWRRVAAGDDCLVDLSRAEIDAAGVPARVADDPDYVRRAGVLDDVASFDAGFFGIGSGDADIMDPQHRHFMECCWEALETAGHVPERFDGAIGVFAGCGFNTYMLHNLLTNPDLVDRVGMFLLRHTANDKDFLATTVSYRLDLRGPSVNVQTACSTSLVAVHLAVQSLLAFECDIALAGGSTIQVPHHAGYTYHEGEILSPEGRCRAFDAASAGTVLTNGAGAVALRRLGDALDDRDPILAVIRGSAVNNDGQRKVGYLAPSVDGHADVVKEALGVAGLSARDIQLLEAHGTGTAVGDPIEVAALTEAFRTSTSDTAFCRLVSTKPNIGHLDTAAGVASLIKTVQALRHETLPPLANHTGPNPLLDLERSPFLLAGSAARWPDDAVRRAGVSSLGVGGTNAHVVVEEAPRRAAPERGRPEQLLALSAMDQDTLERTAARLAEALETEPTLDLADVAHTLATGRRAMSHRRVVAATDTASAVDALRGGDRNRTASSVATDVPPRVAFLLPGGGAHYNGMGAGLDARFDVYRSVLHDGIERVRARSGVDLADLLRVDAAPDALRKATASLPAVFLTSLAMARQWMAWGVEPDALVGHSLGEYTAAHLAGVLTLDGALDLIVARAALMDRVSGVGAAMLAVPLPVDEVVPLLVPALSVATINADDECVIAGPAEDLLLLAKRVEKGHGVDPSPIPLDAAAHSSMLDPVLPEFLQTVSAIELSSPQQPYLSNLTGTWITTEQATDPAYWVDHLRHTVRFGDCLRTVLADGPLVTIEMGPGHALSSYARRQPTRPVVAIPSLRHPNQVMDDTAHALLAVGRAWAVGLDVDLDRFAGADRHRVRLPGYPFRREHHWIDPGEGRLAPEPVRRTPSADEPRARRVADLADSFWAPTWTERPAATLSRGPVGPWLIVGPVAEPFTQHLVDAIAAHATRVDVVADLEGVDLNDIRSVVLLGGAADFTTASRRWTADAAAAARALADVDGAPTLLAAVTRGAADVTTPAAAPLDAMALGIVRTAPREYPELRTALVDLDPATDADDTSLAADAAIVATELFEAADRVVAHRGARRLVPDTGRRRLEPVSDGAPTVRHGGTYLVTGGLGEVGFALASSLAVRHAARLVVVTNRPVPEAAAREAWLARHGTDDPTSRRILRLAALEALGTGVLALPADLADPASVRDLLDRAEAVLGPLDGAIHAAGEVRDRPLALATSDDHEVVLGAKAHGALVLADELERRGASLLVLVSSTSTMLAPEGQTAYVAANSVLDALAGEHGTLDVRTVDYGLWRARGVAALHRARLGIEPGDGVTHPVLTEIAVDRNGATHLIGTLSTAHHWVVDEHRTNDGVAVLPGTAHLELLLAAAELGGAGRTAEAIALLEPLTVPDDRVVTVRVTLDPPDGEATRWARLESDGGGETWRTHSEARLVRAAADPLAGSAPTTRPADVATLDVLGGPSARMRFGPRWRSVEEAWRQGDEIVGRLALPATLRGDVDAWTVHPSLVDVSTMFGMVLGDHGDDLYVPVGYDAVTSLGALPADPWVRARQSGPVSNDVLRLDVQLGGPDGALLAIDGLSLRPVTDSESLAAPRPAELLPPPVLRVPPLLAVAERGGIVGEEGGEMLDRLLASGEPRLIASSIELDDLFELLDRPTDPAGAPDGPTAGGAADASVTASALEAVRAIWSDLLGVGSIGDDDDFFDLGGHSLIAIRMLSRIHKELGVRFQLTAIFEAPTVAALAAQIRAARPGIDEELARTGPSAPVATAPVTAEPQRSLVSISTEGEERPLFVVHGAGGNVLFLWTLARALAGVRPVYGFQAHGVNGDDMPDPTIEAMASRYVGELRAAHQGPYLLGGYSGGGIVAFEMVRQLEALGEEVERLVLFDSPVPGDEGVSLGREWIEFARNTRRHGLRAMRPYLRWRVREAIVSVIPSLARRHGRDESRASAARQIGALGAEDSGFVDLYHYFSAAAERYEMVPLAVDAVLVKADRIWPVRPNDYNWGRFLRGRLDVTGTPGDHWAMFFPENAPTLARALSRELAVERP